MSVAVEGLVKQFRVHRRGAGLRASVGSLVRRRHVEVRAVDGISFSLTAGEVVGFLGPNGAGKTTTLKCLAGLLHPSAGQVRVLGFVPHRRQRAFLEQITLIMGQRNQLFWDLPAMETFLVNQAIYNIPERDFRLRLDELVALLDLEPLLTKQVRKLSLGERMKCEIAASMLHAPRVLFLDEPTIGLDVSAKATIRELLHKRSTDDGTTLLLTSHDTGDIEQVCDRVVIIHRGRILLDAAVGEMKRRYLRSRRITLVTAAEHVDLPAAIGARLISAVPHRTTVEIDAGDAAVGALVDAVLRQTTLRDLMIDDPPMDEIIRSIYRNADLDDDGPDDGETSKGEAA